GAARLPRTTISVGALAADAGAFVPAPARAGEPAPSSADAGAGEAVDEGADAAAAAAEEPDDGATKRTSKRTRARSGLPSRSAGRNRQWLAAAIAALANGSSPLRARALPTDPSTSTTSSSTTVASLGDAPAGNATCASIATGAVTATDGVASAVGGL